MKTMAAPGSGEMFDAIAGRYDLLNRVNSLGLDLGWRRRAIEALALEPGHRLLDLATGTGDLVIAAAARTRDVEIQGLDPSRAMIAIARHKIARRALDRRIQLEIGDARNLPYPDRAFDRVSIAFGIRNIPERIRVLDEVRRVLRPAGRLVVLELSSPRSGAAAALARMYIQHVVPLVGAFLSLGDAYRHLERSIAAFPGRAAFVAEMRSAGFEVLHVDELTFGVATLFVGELAASGAAGSVEIQAGELGEKGAERAHE